MSTTTQAQATQTSDLSQSLSAVAEYHYQLFETVVLPAFKVYPEIAWFADENVNSTQEGIVKPGSVESWTSLLIKHGYLNSTDKKYIELERMLQSLVCLHLLLNDGSIAAYNYWIHGQGEESLSYENFQGLHKLMQTYVNTPTLQKAMEAALVYSDLGKTPEAKKRASRRNLTKTDHDDLIEAILLHPNEEIRNQIIPSIQFLAPDVRENLLKLHSTVPLHWGHAFHLEGGTQMFARLLQVHEVNDADIKRAFLIQVCDVGASAAHQKLPGAFAFKQATYLGYMATLKGIECCVKMQDAELALLELTTERMKLFGYTTHSEPLKAQILTRMGAFLRLTKQEQGSLLREAAETIWQSTDWDLMKKVFGPEVGVNTWRRNPTYMPTVVLNLFNNSLYTELPDKYQAALHGALILAKICDSLEAKVHDSDSPISFNNLAGIANKNPEEFKSNNENSENLIRRFIQTEMTKETPRENVILRFSQYPSYEEQIGLLRQELKKQRKYKK